MTASQMVREARIRKAAASALYAGYGQALSWRFGDWLFSDDSLSNGPHYLKTTA